MSITALAAGGFLPFGPVEEAFSQILQTDWINPASGDWTVGTNWDNGVPDPTSGQAFIANGGTAIISGVQTSTFDLFLGEGSILSTGPNLPGNLLITNKGSLVLTFGAALGAFAPGSIAVEGSSSLQIGQNLTFGFPGHQNGTLTVDGNSNVTLLSTAFLLFQGGTSTITLTNGGSLTLMGSAPGTFNPLNFSKLRSTGNDTDTGPDFGVLNIGTGAGAGILQASTVEAHNPNTFSHVNFNHTDNVTFSIPIEGSIKVSQIGSGTTTLTGANTYAGGTDITGGVLSVGSDANLGTGSLSFSNNAELLTTSRFFTSTKAVTLGTGGGRLASVTGGTAQYGGVISGTGQLSIGDAVNAGTVILVGANTYSGGTTLNFGTLVVGSARALGVGNVVVNGGVLRADRRSINVIGNYTQHTGGTLQLGLGGSATGQYDVLNVNGHAALGGTLQLFSLNGFQPKPGDIFTLGTAAGGLSGRFAQVLNPFPVPPRSIFELFYLPNSFVLELVPMPFALFAQTPNQLAVARQLDRVRRNPKEAQLIAFMDAEPTPNLPRDFEMISPDSLSAVYEISFSAANVQASNLEERFAEIRKGSTGFSSSLNISHAPQPVEGREGKVLIEPNKNVLVPWPENKWGSWIDGSGDYVKVSSDGNGQGYDFTTGGVTFGLDYRLTKNLAVGFAAGYAHTWTDLTGSGKIDADSGRGGLYATYYQGGFYLGGYAGGGYNTYDTTRDTVGGNAIGSTSGAEFDSYVSGGYEFHTGGFSFGPIAALQYTYVDVSENTETGSLAPLRIVSKSADSLRTNLGMSASYAWTTGKVLVTPSVRASWQHEYLYSALPISAQFASGAGSVFTVSGPAEGHDSALLNVGVNVQWTPTIGTYFGYNGQLGRTRYDSQGGVCGVHWDF